MMILFVLPLLRSANFSLMCIFSLQFCYSVLCASQLNYHMCNKSVCMHVGNCKVTDVFINQFCRHHMYIHHA